MYNVYLTIKFFFSKTVKFFNSVKHRAMDFLTIFFNLPHTLPLAFKACATVHVLGLYLPLTPTNPFLQMMQYFFYANRKSLFSFSAIF